MISVSIFIPYQHERKYEISITQSSGEDISSFHFRLNKSVIGLVAVSRLQKNQV